MNNRYKNPWFWIGLIGVVLTAMGVNPEMFTSWGVVWQTLKELVVYVRLRCYGGTGRIRGADNERIERW